MKRLTVKHFEFNIQKNGLEKKRSFVTLLGRGKYGTQLSILNYVNKTSFHITFSFILSI